MSYIPGLLFSANKLSQGEVFRLLIWFRVTFLKSLIHHYLKYLVIACYCPVTALLTRAC
jgi:hypothetical protein